MATGAKPVGVLARLACRCLRWSALVAAAGLMVDASACATTSPRRPPGSPPPPVEHLIEVPEASDDAVEPTVTGPGLTHLMRGLYFLAQGKPNAAIPHLRLGLIYDETSPFIHERLSLAWGASGDRERARAVLEEGLRDVPDSPSLNSLAGRLAVEERRYEVGVEHLRKAVAEEATMTGAGPALVSALLWLGRYDEADVVARELIHRAPGEADMALALAAHFEDHGRLEAALAAYRHAHEQRPADRTAVIGETRVLDLQGATHDAVDALVSLFRFYPDAPELYVEITRLLRRLGSADAQAYRDEALRQTAAEPSDQLIVAAGDLLEGHDEDGIALLRTIIHEQPGDVRARAFLAEVLDERGDAEGCLAALTPPPGGSDPFHRARAACWATAGRADRVVESLAAAVGAGEPAAELLSDLARLLPGHVPDADARAAFDRLKTELGPELESVAVERATAVLADGLGEGERALDAGRRVYAVEPESVPARLRLADLEVKYGEVERGVAMLEELVHEDPYDYFRLNALGFTLADENLRLDEASIWLRRAYRLSPEDGFIIDSLGWLFNRQGRFTEALQILQRAARASVGDPEILRHLGDTYRALGRHDDARRAYDRAMALHPPPALRRLLLERQAEYAAGAGAS